ncbi:hypothetical protein CYMTET_51035 [Cymbomonas tetramitiformis]|uniref:Uncharacterized protein n=1 Tax=Cymbomonas tetramitiformis TaxID=36881 RepID=A0AAE0BM04_9CHLO|nr:hypothetical protein CYMTET_51035 [Cymbomonas tetramitiformis]
MSGEHVSLGSRLRVARDSDSTPSRTPAASPQREQPPDPIVRMSTLRPRPTPVSRSATSAEFHHDDSVWVSTPVRASQRTEFVEKLDYAFSYGEELAKLLRAHGFKSNVGITLDGPEAESDFAVLLANLSHVFGPISRDEIMKLLDLDFEYSEYHLTLNELIYAVLPTLLRGTALTLYEESAHRLTYAALALRLGKVFRDESPFTRLAAPPPPAPGGGGRSGGGKSTATTVGTLSRSPPLANADMRRPWASGRSRKGAAATWFGRARGCRA